MKIQKSDNLLKARKFKMSRLKIITPFEEINEIAKEMAKNKHIKAVYLFGSYASGKQHALSDIDLCVIRDKIDEKSERDALKYSSDNLDISMFDMLPIYIKIRVFSEGKPLIIKDEEFVNFVKIKTLQEYLDFKPLINKYIKEVLNV